MAFLRDGDQLLLDLGMPWDGVSPRYLTRGFVPCTFAGTSPPQLGDPPELTAQVEMFPEGTPYGTST